MTSRMTRRETLLALLYLPIHAIGLPLLASFLVLRGVLTPSWANLLVYAIGAAVIVAVLFGFLRRDFDTLCDNTLMTVVVILQDYALAICSSIAVSMLFEALGLTQNENNDAIYEMAASEFGPIAAAGAILAPIVEECIFRGAIFGTLRRRSRALAYIVSALLFSLYHVWQAALYDPTQLWYLLQYIPASLILARCYERCDSIWGVIFLHMLNNGLPLLAVAYLNV